MCTVNDVKNCLSESVEMTNMHSKKVKVIPGGQDLSVRQHSRVFYSKECTPLEVENLLVCPSNQSIRIFKANGRDHSARSYVEVVKNKSNNTKNIEKS